MFWFSYKGTTKKYEESGEPNHLAYYLVLKMSLRNAIIALAFYLGVTRSERPEIAHYVRDNNGQRILVANHLLNDAIIPESRRAPTLLNP